MNEESIRREAKPKRRICYRLITSVTPPHERNNPPLDYSSRSIALRDAAEILARKNVGDWVEIQVVEVER